jgi:hypothetical protein
MLKRKYLDFKEGMKNCPQGKKLSSFSELANIDRIIGNAESEYGRVLILSSLKRS